MISTPGYETLVTDSVKNTDPEAAREYGFDRPFYELNFNFGPKPIVQSTVKN